MDMYEEEVDFANSNLSFPQKLFALLEYESDGMIQWAPNGLCFRLTDQDRFASEVVPKYFKQTKLTSFQRQLNLYGFRRLAKGEDQGCYFHPRFQRGRRDLLNEIKRLPVKGSLPSYDQLLSSTRPGPYQYDPNNSRKRSATDMTDSTEDGNAPRRKMTTRLSSQQQQQHQSDDPTAPATDISRSSHGSTAQPSQALVRNFYAAHQSVSSHFGNTTASAQNNSGNQGQQRMSKLTMNIGFGKNSFTSPPENSKSNAANASRSTASPAHGMGLRNNNRPLYRQPNQLPQSTAATTNNPYSNSSFYYQLPYSFPASALPMSSNFASESSRVYYPQQQASANTNYTYYNNNTQQQPVGFNYQQQFQQQQQQDYLKEQNDFTSFAAMLNEGSERAPSLLGDDLDVLDLFSGDIPQSTHGTPIPNSQIAESLAGFDTSVLLSEDGRAIPAGDSESM